MDAEDLKSEISFGLWRTWSHAFQNNVIDSTTKKLMIKALVSEYWCLFEKGARRTTDGRRRLMELFNKINELICYRLMTEPRLQMSLFTPHLVGPNRQVWPKPSRVVGLAPI